MSQTAQSQDLKSDEVSVTVNEKPACRIEMVVKTSPDMVKAARKNAIKAVSKEITLPGFRKGKAPEEIILKKFPQDVEKQMHKSVADLAFPAAQKIAKVPVLNNSAPISFDLKDISEKGAELTFTFETEPKIPEIDREAFKLKPVERAPVGEKEIDEAIRQMRYFYAKWTPVTDRPIQDGDYIMINLDTIEGDEAVRVFNQIRFEVSKSRMADWMKKLVQGAKQGDVLEGVSEVDETASEEEKKEFSPKNVRITILKVEGAELPPIDDEFALKVGAPDVEKMRASVEDLLKKQAEEKAMSQEREQVNDFLIKEHECELPKSLIDTEKKHRITQMAQDPKFKAQWEKMSEEEKKALDEKLQAESTSAVKLFYLSRKIVQDQKIPVTHQEVENEAISIYQSHGQQVQADQLPKEIYALALSKVILAKAQDHILKKA